VLWTEVPPLKAYAPAPTPTAVLLAPVLFNCMALAPNATLKLPVVVSLRAFSPKAELKVAVVLRKRSNLQWASGLPFKKIVLHATS
jgi:hypothetical protein